MDRCLTAPLRPLPSPATGLPRLRDPLSRRAVPITPVDRSRCICRLLPCPCCLLRTLGGSASTTSLSRPAQALHTLRPVDSLPRQKQGLSQGFGTASYPTAPPASYRANRPLPGWDFHPLGERALRDARRVEERRGIVCTTRFPSPLIKPDVRLSRIRLSDWLRGRLTTGRLGVCNGAVSAHQACRRPRSS